MIRVGCGILANVSVFKCCISSTVNYSIVPDSFEDEEASGDFLEHRDILDEVLVDGEDTADHIVVKAGEIFPVDILASFAGGSR